MGLTIPTDLATWLDPDSRARFERLPARRRRAYVASIEQAQSREPRDGGSRGPFRTCAKKGALMLREFSAELQKGDNKGAWTCVVWDGAASSSARGARQGPRTIDGEPFGERVHAQGDGTHRLPGHGRDPQAIGRQQARRAAPVTAATAAIRISLRATRERARSGAILALGLIYSYIGIY